MCYYVSVIPTNISINNLDDFDLYEILGLGSWAASVDCETIKKAYHKAVLLYHPDKQQNVAACEEDARAVFLKIQEANSTLSNESKRRAYDSQLDFDEGIPSEDDAKEASHKGIQAFVDLFDPVFKRNARFAVNKPVPGIGNADTPLAQVQRFYDYWVNFDSWRDFTNVSAEHNVDSATSREEKRWMIKENDRGAKKLKKKEMARLTELVMRAMNFDPRLLQEKERVQLEKQAAKEARMHEKNAELEALAKLRADEEAKVEAEKEAKRQQKLDWERTKKEASKGRNTFRKLLRARAVMTSSENEYGTLTGDDVELLCQHLEMAQISSLNESLGGEAALVDASLLSTDDGCLQSSLREVREKLAAIARQEEEALDERRKLDNAKANEAELKKRGLTREWSREDLSTLSKAIGKFPGGMKQRWVAVCNYMNDILKPVEPFTRDECMKAAHHATEHLAAMKESGGIGVGFKKMGVSGSVALKATAVPGTQQSPGLPQPPIANATSAPAKVEPPAAPTGSDEGSVWTQDQQRLLEEGLKKYPASMDKAERWNKIAGDVPGKTRKDCISRYKQLREELQAKKTGTTSS